MNSAATCGTMLPEPCVQRYASPEHKDENSTSGAYASVCSPRTRLRISRIFFDLDTVGAHRRGGARARLWRALEGPQGRCSAGSCPCGEPARQAREVARALAP